MKDEAKGIILETKQVFDLLLDRVLTREGVSKGNILDLQEVDGKFATCISFPDKDGVSQLIIPLVYYNTIEELGSISETIAASGINSIVDTFSPHLGVVKQITGPKDDNINGNDDLLVLLIRIERFLLRNNIPMDYTSLEIAQNKKTNTYYLKIVFLDVEWNPQQELPFFSFDKIDDFTKGLKSEEAIIDIIKFLNDSLKTISLIKHSASAKSAKPKSASKIEDSGGGKPSLIHRFLSYKKK